MAVILPCLRRFGTVMACLGTILRIHGHWQ
jgi:hypothetical protein